MSTLMDQRFQATRETLAMNRWRMLGSALLATLLVSPVVARAQGFQGVFSKDGVDAWAVGDGGVWYRTFDGGLRGRAERWDRAGSGRRGAEPRGPGRGRRRQDLAEHGQRRELGADRGAGMPELRAIAIASDQVSYVVGRAGRSSRRRTGRQLERARPGNGSDAERRDVHRRGPWLGRGRGRDG